jgi:hypothetical protein
MYIRSRDIYVPRKVPNNVPKDLAPTVFLPGTGKPSPGKVRIPKKTLERQRVWEDGSKVLADYSPGFLKLAH